MILLGDRFTWLGIAAHGVRRTRHEPWPGQCDLVDHLVNGADLLARQLGLSPGELANVRTCRLAVVGVLFALLVPSDRVLSIAARPALTAHLVMSLLAYSLFTIAALHAILTAVLDSGLRHGNTPTALRDAPPLIALETLLLRIIQLGFVLLTLALASGFLFSEQVFGKAITFPHNAHKVIFGVLSWLIYGAFLVGHRIYGWRGRTAATLTLVGFGLLLLSYVGSKFVLEVILQRA